MLFPDAADPKQREMLFVSETNETIAVWEGEKLTIEQATQRSGIQRVHWLTDFEPQFRSVMCQADQVYLNSNEHIRAVIPTETRETRFTHRCRQESAARLLRVVLEPTRAVAPTLFHAIPERPR